MANPLRQGQMKISLKGPGKSGGWFWVLPHDNRGIPAQRQHRYHDLNRCPES